MAEARSDKEKTKKELRLGDKEDLVVKDVVVDVDGFEHVRYDRTYQGLPVIGGDLVVHEAGSGRIISVSYASNDRLALQSTDAGIPAPDGASPSKVVFARDHKPVLAWEATITGTSQDGTPIKDVVYTAAHNGKELGRTPLVVNATGTGSSLYSGSVGVQTTLSGSTYQLTTPRVAATGPTTRTTPRARGPAR